MAFESFPMVIGFELTLACNLRCKHCASSAGHPRQNELRLDEILHFCDQFPDLLVQEVDITGGEPLFREDWFPMATYLNRKLNIPVRIVSNGVLLKENISRLIDAGISTVGISLDGLEYTHDSIRKRPGLFKQIISGIEAALRAEIPIAVITAANNANIDELPELRRALIDLGVHHWQVQPTFCRGRAREENVDISEPSFMKLGAFIHRHNNSSSNENNLSMVPADGVGYYTELDTRGYEWNGCTAGISTCGITADGKIKGCLSLPDTFVEGDLRERDLWRIWFDKTSFRYNRAFAIEDLGENCTNCEFGRQCQGGCSVMSLAATQQLHNNPYCFHRIVSNQPQEGAGAIGASAAFKATKVGQVM